MKFVWVVASMLMLVAAFALWPRAPASIFLPDPVAVTLPVPHAQPVREPARAPVLNAGFCAPPGERLVAYARPSLEAAMRTGSAQTRAALNAFAHANSQRESDDAIAQAFAAAPTDPAIAFAYAHSVLNTKTSDAARAAFAVYLAAHPRDMQTARLNARLGTQHEIEESMQVEESGGFSLRYPSALVDRERAQLLLSKIQEDVQEAAALTQTPARTQLVSVLYRDRSELLAVTCTPNWAGGVYDGTLRLVYDDSNALGVATDARRHEALHAQLSPILPPQPLWFHEGLAQFFAARGNFRLLPSHRLMRDAQTYIPFSSLEGSFFVFDGNADAALAYAQSAAMVQMLYDMLGAQAIPRAIARLRAHPREPQLIESISAPATIDEHTLLKWLDSKDPARPR